MIPGPIAVLIIAAVAFQISPEPFSWTGFLLFAGVAFVVWAALHLALGRLLAWVAHQRRPVDAMMVEALAKNEAWGEADRKARELRSDPIYAVTFILSVVAKWVIVTWVAWAVVFQGGAGNGIPR